MIAKHCTCGRSFDLEAWEALPWAGRDPTSSCLMVDERRQAPPPGRSWEDMPLISRTTYELRNCPCESTIALEVARTGIEPYADDEITARRIMHLERCGT